MNNIPEGWRSLALEEITREESLRVGRRQGVRVLSSTKHHGLVPSDEYFKNRTIYSSDLSNYKLVPRNYFAYATNHLAEGSIGLQRQYDIACVSPAYTVFSCDLKQIDVNYMFRLLKSPPMMAAYGIHEQASVDRRGAVRYRDFSRIKVLLPPKEEQRRIAEILDALHGRVASLEEELEKLDTIQSSLVYDLLSGISGPTVSMADVCNSITVGIVVQPSQYYVDSGVPVLRSKNVREDGIDLTDVRFMSRSVHERNLKTAAEVGDLVTVRTGAPGLTAVIPPSLSSVNCVDILISRPKESVVSEYLALWINSELGRGQVLRGQGGLAQQHFNVSEMKKLRVALPEIDGQRKIVQVATAGKELSGVMRAEIRKLRLLEKGLAEDLLTGRVRVPEAEAVVESL